MTIVGYIIFCLIVILNIIYGIRKKKSNALYAIALVVIFFLMTFNYEGPDIGVYRITYDLVGNSANLRSAFNVTYMEKGYTLLMFCANKLGLDFYAFRIILTFICLALFVSTIRYYKVNPNLIMGLYMVYLLFFDTIQLRNCIIEFIILFATRYLTKRGGLSILKYIVCIAVAGTIHTLAWLFLALLLVRFVKSKKGYKNIFIVAASMFALCVLLQPVLPNIVEVVTKLLKRGSGYLQSTISYGYWAVMALHVIALLPLYWYAHRIDDKDTRHKIYFILKIGIIMGLFLPLSFLNNNLNRIFRNTLILDTIGLTLLYENSKKKTQSNDVTILLELLLVGGWLGTDLMRYEVANIIGSVMNNNLVYTYFNSTNVGQYLLVISICLVLTFILKMISSSTRVNHKKEGKCA